MSEIRFDIEFAGELVPGTDPGQARAQLQSRFKLSDAAVGHLFSGAPMRIRRGVDGTVATRLHQAFAEAGAVTRILPAGEDTDGEPDTDLARHLTSPIEPPSLDPFGWSAPHPSPSRIDPIFHWFERSLAFVLLLLISAVAVIAVVELCFVLYKDLISSSGFLLGLNELFEVFGMFLLVLIAVELMASIYMYMMDKSVHVEIMLLIAITALTRKVVVMDLESKGDPAMYMLGLAALLATLIGGFYLVKRLDPRLFGGHR